MKKLQNNFTTPEQSKRLLELEVPADSADCYFGSYPGHPDWAVIRQSGFDTEDDALFRLNEDIIPCWSVGRLLDIIRICNSSLDNRTFHLVDNMCDSLVALIEFYQMDFSKLEG